MLRVERNRDGHLDTKRVVYGTKKNETNQQNQLENKNCEGVQNPQLRALTFGLGMFLLSTPQQKKHASMQQLPPSMLPVEERK